MTIPNLITCLRIILAPVFIIYLIQDQFLPALVVFIVAGITDGADGLIARVFNQKSRIGSFLDPLADKILLVAAFVTLAVRDNVPPWLTVLAISRDILILLGVLILFLSKGDLTIRPSYLSKATTCLQLLTVFVALSGGYADKVDWSTAHDFFTKTSPYVFLMTGLLTVMSGLHYMWYWFHAMGEGPPASQ
jgi:cardiolipin synthase (CMP-forming)